MTNTMYGLDFSEDPAAPDFPTNPIIIGNGATLMSNAGDRKGQGMERPHDRYFLQSKPLFHNYFLAHIQVRLSEFNLWTV